MATAFPANYMQYYSTPSATNSGLPTAAAQAGKTAGMDTITSQLPGYMTSMSNIGTKIASETAGQVPDDVIAELKQQGAESNVVTGAASNAAYLHALGLTSLGLQEQGQKDLESILPSTPGYNLSQNPEFQTSANLQYEQALQPQVFARQDEQASIGQKNAQAALAAAKSGYGAGAGGPGANTDPLGFANMTTATLPGQTPAGGASTVFSPANNLYGGGFTPASVSPWQAPGVSPWTYAGNIANPGGTITNAGGTTFNDPYGTGASSGVSGPDESDVYSDPYSVYYGA